MYIYHLLNRSLVCRLVLSLLMKSQLFSIDPETLLDLNLKVQSHFHAVKRKKRQSSEDKIAGLSLVSSHIVFTTYGLTSESVCRSKDRRPSQSPQPEGRESWGWKGTRTQRWIILNLQQKLSNYCQNTSQTFSTSYESKSVFFSKEVRVSTSTLTWTSCCVNRDKTKAARG